MPLNITVGLTEQIGEIARRAGRIIMDIYKTDFDVESKDDSSPVTKADQEAEDLIFRAIREGITSEFPMVGEEAASAGNVPDVSGHTFWLIDPLDGTKEFISRNGEFTVNIALIENGIPVMGVVHLPVTDDTYIGSRAGSFAQYGGSGTAGQIQCRQPAADGLVAIASRSHGSEAVDTYLEKFPIKERIGAGSSLKFCRVAEGKADIYPRFGPTMEWDTAAGHAVLMYAGGEVVKEDGTGLQYGKPDFRNPFFIARGPNIPEPSA